MNTRIQSGLAFSLLVSLLFLATGCAAKPRNVTGKVALGSNLKFADSDVLTVTFTPEKNDGQMGVANLDKDLSFKMQLVPGKYKVSFEARAYPGEKDGDKRSDAYKKKFEKFDATKSSLTYDVTEDETQNLTVDFAQGKITKN